MSPDRSPTPASRTALLADRSAIARNVAAAFAADPAWRFLLGERYEQLAPEFAGALFDQRVGAGTVWVCTDAASVAMWDGPGLPDDNATSYRAIWERFHALADADTALRLRAYNQAIERAAPSHPFWYLGVLATHPTHQRTGLARAVLEPGLATASAAGVPCFLETSTEGNRGFYERRGFTVEREITVPGGPRTWWMRR